MSGREINDWRSAFWSADEVPAGASGPEKQKRGFTFEKILRAMLAEENLDPKASYKAVGEQIDGSFDYEGRTFLLEAKWTGEELPASTIYEFRGKVEGKLIGTIGVFISMAGYSDDAVDALRYGKTVNLVLFDGDDIREIITGRLTFARALALKLRAAAEVGTPLRLLAEPLTAANDKAAATRAVIVEGRLDVVLVQALVAVYGPSRFNLRIAAAGGPANLGPIAELAATGLDFDTDQLVVIADSDDANAQLVEYDLDRSVADLESAGWKISKMVVTPSLEVRLGVLPEGEFVETLVGPLWGRFCVLSSRLSCAVRCHLEMRNSSRAM